MTDTKEENKNNTIPISKDDDKIKKDNDNHDRQTNSSQIQELSTTTKITINKNMLTKLPPNEYKIKQNLEKQKLNITQEGLCRVYNDVVHIDTP